MRIRRALQGTNSCHSDAESSKCCALKKKERGCKSKEIPQDRWAKWYIRTGRVRTLSDRLGNLPVMVRARRGRNYA
jgi:hypothetical protein